ncbi:unnamed protein product [Nippostrongylus brasiliensis]|uniref:Biotin--protein ligase (inferred by orthology to a human protein) n=1 Tax=Nippostrongylus brasiliensis TaxID=27835 RepID=A0A0N4XM27_NIPBR|nr:unnamed protein product [Nippostrongylus brasiliensis]
MTGRSRRHVSTLPSSTVAFASGPSCRRAALKCNWSNIANPALVLMRKVGFANREDFCLNETVQACLIVADTSELDDHAWANMQHYFNQAGKIIFVCQNRLLASLTTCESSKKQADMIRMAFGSRDSISMGKDFEHFLKKSLKTLSKHGQVCGLYTIDLYID